MPEQFLGLTQKISKNKINLKLFYIFYRDYICPYKYTYFLETGETIELIFEKNNFPHILGLHKFNKISSIDKAEDVLASIYQEAITAQSLKQSEPNIYNLPLVIDRLRYFPTLKTILDTSEVIIEFDPTKCIPTKIEADFFIYSNKIKVIIFLAIRKTSIQDKKIICYPVSFLVDRVDKFQKEKQKHLNVSTIKIDK